MTFRFNAKHLAICLSLTAFFSCKKDDNTPTPPPADPTLFELVQGRWNAELEPYGRTGNVSAKGQDMAHVAAIEFFSDSTYIISYSNDYQNNAVTGKFKPVDSVSFNLTGEDITAISDLKITEDSISFSYEMYDDVFTIKAAKAENLAISEANKSLLKAWSVERDEEDGETLYTQYEVGEGGEITMFFSAAGTLLTNIKNDGHEIASVLNWKWHPSVANAAQLFTLYGEPLYNSYYKIISISSTSLTIEEVRSTPDGDVSRTLVLTAK